MNGKQIDLELSQQAEERPHHIEMTLRDHFAAFALQGLIIHHADADPNELAHLAYVFADAMLHEREAQHGLRMDVIREKQLSQ